MAQVIAIATARAIPPQNCANPNLIVIREFPAIIVRLCTPVHDAMLLFCALRGCNSEVGAAGL
jgi:hypothetical protein